MKKIFLSIVFLVASLSWGMSSGIAAPACPDTSYIAIHVTLNPSDCLNLGVCPFKIQLWMLSSIPKLLVEKSYDNGVDEYDFCIPSPVNYSVCAILVPFGPCNNTLTCTPACVFWDSYPQH